MIKLCYVMSYHVGITRSENVVINLAQKNSQMPKLSDHSPGNKV